MVQAKSKKSVGLGNMLMKDRFGNGKGSNRKRAGAVARINHSTGEEYIINDREEASWVKMRSVTETGPLEEFLATAALAGTDFTAQKTDNFKIIRPTKQNMHLLSAQEERAVRGKHKQNKHRLEVPRRPQWDEKTTPEELDMREREAFLDWRRSMAQLEEVEDLLMTPFERNLEVWRQLWRVIERCDIVVQIVDARSPLLFRSDDLEDYVTTVSPKKKNLLLINKADMLTLEQRQVWARYLKENGIEYRFFSAQLANDAQELHEAEVEEEEEDDGRSQSEKNATQSDENIEPCLEEHVSGERRVDEGGTAAAADDEDSQILTVDGLQDMFLRIAPDRADSDKQIAVGLVGYPNVGKSSTINALCGAKKVSVSVTPGKTKHFQTIHLSDQVMLCDCPGLVFPNFAATKAELVCNGILPIDQLREYTGPAGLVASRVPKAFLEAVYGIKIKMRPLEEGGSGIPTAEELLNAYACARSFWTTGHGTADESRAARLILKDYVSGKLVYCEPPPGTVDPTDFNRELYTLDHMPEKRRAILEKRMRSMRVGDDIVALSSSTAPTETNKSRKIDDGFFGPGGSAAHLTHPFNHKYTEQGQHDRQMKQLSSRKALTMYALENGLDPKDVRFGGKKHYKGGRKGKVKKKALANTD